jgi:hypothetical protein
MKLYNIFILLIDTQLHKVRLVWVNTAQTENDLSKYLLQNNNNYNKIIHITVRQMFLIYYNMFKYQL